MLYNREGAIDVCEQYKETHKDVYFNFADYRSANVGLSTITVGGTTYNQKYISVTVNNFKQFLDSVLGKYINDIVVVSFNNIYTNNSFTLFRYSITVVGDLLI